jgi:hypothetical protein
VTTMLRPFACPSEKRGPESWLFVDMWGKPSTSRSALDACCVRLFSSRPQRYVRVVGRVEDPVEDPAQVGPGILCSRQMKMICEVCPIFCIFLATSKLVSKQLYVLVLSRLIALPHSVRNIAIHSHPRYGRSRFSSDVARRERRERAQTARVQNSNSRRWHRRSFICHRTA